MIEQFFVRSFISKLRAKTFVIDIYDSITLVVLNLANIFVLKINFAPTAPTIALTDHFVDTVMSLGDLIRRNIEPNFSLQVFRKD